MNRILTHAVLLALAMTLPTAVKAGGFAQRENVREFIEEMREKHGFDSGRLARLAEAYRAAGPESLALLEPLVAGWPGAPARLERVRAVPFVSTLTVMAGYGDAPPPDFDAWFPFEATMLHAIGNDSSKRSPGAELVLVLQARPLFSLEHLDRPPEEWARELVWEAGELLGPWAGRPRWTWRSSSSMMPPVMTARPLLPGDELKARTRTSSTSKVPRTVMAAAGGEGSALFSAISASMLARPSPATPVAGKSRQSASRRVQPLTCSRTAPGRADGSGRARKRTRNAGKTPVPSGGVSDAAPLWGQLQTQLVPSWTQLAHDPAATFDWGCTAPDAASIER